MIECSYVENFIRVQALKICEEISKYQTSDAKNYELVRKKFEKIFGLSHDALDFFEFAYIYQASNYIYHYIVILMCRKHETKISRMCSEYEYLKT